MNIINSIKSVKNSIIWKLVISYLFIVLIPIVICGAFILNYIQESVKKDLSNIVESQMRQLNTNITEKVELCKQNAALIAHDINYSRFFQENEYSDLFLVDTILHEIVPRLETIKIQNKYIYKLRIIHGNPSIPITYDSLYYYKDFIDGKWNNAPEELKNRKAMGYNEIYVEALHNERVNSAEDNNSKKRNVFSIYIPMYTVLLDRIVGIVEADILDDIILQPIKQVNLKENEVVNLVYRNGDILYSNKKSFKPASLDTVQSTGSFKSITIDGEEMYLFSINVKSIESWVVIYIPKNMLLYKNSYKVIIIAILFTGVVTLGILSYFLSKLMTNNLIKLSRTINKIKKGNLDARVDIRSSDEIGVLAGNFNEMVGHINQLIVNLNKANKAEKEAIYKALENQVNPHFLCNALEMIRMTAEVHNDGEVASAAELIARYFMYNIKRKSKYVTLMDEMKNVTEYIEIYNLVKNNNIRMNVNVRGILSGTLDAYYVLKFILQPVVENSIKHGFKDMKDGCNIGIDLRHENDTIVITVEDNGSGISAGRLEELGKYLDINLEYTGFKASGSGIGLKNINERLKMSFGDNYGLWVESREGLGTATVLKMPALTEVKNIDA